MNLFRLARNEILIKTKASNTLFSKLGSFTNLYFKAYFTRSGHLARRLRIQFSIDEKFSNAQDSISRSKFRVRSIRKADEFQVKLVITQDISFDPYLIFRFCLEWVQRSDNSTIFCDFIEEGRTNPFIKGRWDFLYHRSVNLLAPMYLESRFACSLSPIKLDGVVVKICPTIKYLQRLSSPLRVTEYKSRKLEDLAGVSIIIPTANKVVLQDGKRCWLIGEIVSEISRVKKIPFQFVIVHNGNMTRKQMASLRNFGDIKFIHFKDTKLNISKKINLGVEGAKYEKIILANDDIKGASHGWLEKLVCWLDESYAGIVVPRIHYTNGLLQYAGIEMDATNETTPHILGYRTSGENQGYGFSFKVPRQLDAATGVIMAMRKSVFKEVGGWNEKLAINYNDVDFGLRVREAGYSIVFEPNARIFHLESASRDPSLPIRKEALIFSKLFTKYSLESFWKNLAHHNERESPSIGFDFYIGSLVQETNPADRK
jgi:GT2 family glycosyltransferase